MAVTPSQVPHSTVFVRGVAYAPRYRAWRNQAYRLDAAAQIDGIYPPYRRREERLHALVSVCAAIALLGVAVLAAQVTAPRLLVGVMP